jgi:hypothetical protein
MSEYDPTDPAILRDENGVPCPRPAVRLEYPDDGILDPGSPLPWHYDDDCGELVDAVSNLVQNEHGFACCHDRRFAEWALNNARSYADIVRRLAVAARSEDIAAVQRDAEKLWEEMQQEPKVEKP